MVFSEKLYLVSVFTLLGVSVAHAADRRELGGFELGGSFEAAQKHARGQEWELVPLSENLPGRWTVKGASLSLFVCDGVVSSISEKLEGDLEEFAALVFAMQLEFGEPEIQILSLSSGVGQISTIDVRFENVDGGSSVQLQSIGGKRSFSANHWMETECQ